MEQENLILEQVKQEYMASIPSKISLLHSLRDQFKQSQTLGNLKMLRMEIHKLAGNAGTYGFANVSKICQQFDQELVKNISEFSDLNFDQKWWNRLDEALIEIEKEFKSDGREK